MERLYPAPNAKALAKALDHVDEEAARFIALSTFCILASAGPDGDMDVSPRGGPAGFVVVDGPRRLILPDRPGNNRIDSLRNLAGRRSGVALLFVIPGVD
ncbi:pyridoxamine 5'-phosphate oxidase family protein, partial [Mycobacterium tuberculosis]